MQEKHEMIFLLSQKPNVHVVGKGLTRKWKYLDFEVHTFVSKIGLKSHEN